MGATTWKRLCRPPPSPLHTSTRAFVCVCKDDTALAVCVHCLRGYGSALPCGASRYYESLHETPLIANTIARKKLFEMNRYTPDYMRFRGSFRAETLTFGTVARIYMRFRGSLRAMMPNNLHLERLLASTQLNRTRACLAAVSSRTPPSTAATCTARCAYPRGLSRPAIGSNLALVVFVVCVVWLSVAHCGSCPLWFRRSLAAFLCGFAAFSPPFLVVSLLSVDQAFLTERRFFSSGLRAAPDGFHENRRHRRHRHQVQRLRLRKKDPQFP